MKSKGEKHFLFSLVTCLHMKHQKMYVQIDKHLYIMYVIRPNDTSKVQHCLSCILENLVKNVKATLVPLLSVPFWCEMFFFRVRQAVALQAFQQQL